MHTKYFNILYLCQMYFYDRSRIHNLLKYVVHISNAVFRNQIYKNSNLGLRYKFEKNVNLNKHTSMLRC